MNNSPWVTLFNAAVNTMLLETRWHNTNGDAFSISNTNASPYFVIMYTRPSLVEHCGAGGGGKGEEDVLKAVREASLGL